jgi:hypothetical protein
MFKRFLLFVSFVVISYGASSQFQFWNDLVAWDGHTNYVSYFIMSPAYFGPNALPVPELKNGLVSEQSYFQILGQQHVGKGDNTTNLFGKFYASFFDKIGVEVFMVPLEYYKLSPATRDERMSRTLDAEGLTVGDVYFGTTIQLLKDSERWSDMTVSMYCKTTSGGQINDLRYTDTPGYYFDLSFGKDFKSAPISLDQLRWYTSFGFYNWQTNMPRYMQNDAVLLGAGLQMNKNTLQLDAQFTGYIGYIGGKDFVQVPSSKLKQEYDGDIPVVFRLNAMIKEEKLNWKLMYQAGLHDFTYQTLSLGIQKNINYPE